MFLYMWYIDGINNGLAERAVYKSSVLKGGKEDERFHTRQNLSILVSLNTPQTTTIASPAELLLGHKMRTVLDIIKPDLQEGVESEQEHQKVNHDKHSKYNSFTACEQVFAKNFTPG